MYIKTKAVSAAWRQPGAAARLQLTYFNQWCIEVTTWPTTIKGHKFPPPLWFPIRRKRTLLLASLFGCSSQRLFFQFPHQFHLGGLSGDFCKRQGENYGGGPNTKFLLVQVRSSNSKLIFSTHAELHKTKPALQLWYRNTLSVFWGRYTASFTPDSSFRA